MLEEKTTRIRRTSAGVLMGIIVLLLGGFLISRFVSSGVGVGDGSAAEIHSSTIEATNDTSRTASVVNSGSEGIDLQTIAVINLSDHPVMRAIAQRLAEDLGFRKMVDAVELYDAAATGAMPEPGGALPSTFITLDLTRFEEAGQVRDGRTVDATIRGTIGPELWESNRHYTDQLTPPFIQAGAAVTIKHHSVTTGSEAPDAKSAQLIDSLATEAINQINGQITEWAGEYGLMTGNPAGLMPAYRPLPAELPLPDDSTLTQMISGPRLMTHNHTVWTVDADNTSALLSTLRDQLAATGWKVGGGPADAESELFHIRAFDSDRGRVLEAFRARPSWDQTPSSGPERLIIRYLDRMTLQEMKPVFERWLEDETVDPLSLIDFDRNMTAEVSDRLWARLAERTDLPLAAELRVIRHLDGRGEPDRARARLDHAHLLALFAPDDEQKKLKELAEKIHGEPNQAPPSPTDAQLEAIGAVRLVSNGKVSTEVGLGQSAKFYQRLPDRLVLLGVTVERATIPEGTYKLVFADHTDEAVGGNMSTTPHHPPSPWTAMSSFNLFSARATEVSPERFRVDLQIRDPG
jgi:hypothetical protein